MILLPLVVHFDLTCKKMHFAESSQCSYHLEQFLHKYGRKFAKENNNSIMVSNMFLDFVCFSVQSCPYSDLPDDIVKTPMQGEYVDGANVTFSCRNGFILDGISSSSCMNGYWVPQTYPSCIGKSFVPIDEIESWLNSYFATCQHLNFVSSKNLGVLSGN